LLSSVMDFSSGLPTQNPCGVDSWAYIFDILGSTTPVWHKAGYRLDEVVLWNAFADVLVGLATVKRCTFGWTLQGSTKPVLQAMPEPGPPVSHHDSLTRRWPALSIGCQAMCTWP
jgi:hypothetical protein